ncbi:MAG: DUF721 domain-containing protein [Candidatus Omnitrophica bacterium]|nr:DUF721 domain-containing protein [Candidatus Omnitrophota bacterium]
MDNIKDIINTVIGHLSEKKVEDEKNIERIWSSINNPKDLAHMKILGMKDGELTVILDSPSRLYHMNMKKASLMKNLREEGGVIKKIKFKIGSIS